ncbi:MAG: pyridoxal-phosphate dependent enzyme, partial [Planctomycetes bacterium]|nr:pyridoxal-phosphate dependent enzyme [Planctomycetota bacterium]
RDESGGQIDAVTDDEIVAAYKLLAELEGVFAEPASAASVAGLLKVVGRGEVESKAVVVCTLTGHGLKDPERAIKSSKPVTVVDASFDALRQEIER